MAIELLLGGNAEPLFLNLAFINTADEFTQPAVRQPQTQEQVQTNMKLPHFNRCRPETKQLS